MPFWILLAILITLKVAEKIDGIGYKTILSIMLITIAFLLPFINGSEIINDLIFGADKFFLAKITLEIILLFFSVLLFMYLRGEKNLKHS